MGQKSLTKILVKSRCLKITEKVSFTIASEASYVYILSGQKLIKNAKKWSILASFWKPEACGQTELPDRSVLTGQKLVENAEIKKKLRYFELFSNTVEFEFLKLFGEFCFDRAVLDLTKYFQPCFFRCGMTEAKLPEIVHSFHFLFLLGGSKMHFS